MGTAFDFRPRSNTALLDASIEFIRAHFGTLATMMAIGQIPALAVGLVFPTSTSKPFARFHDHPVLAALQVTVMLWFGVVTSVAFVLLVDDLINGREPSLARSFRVALGRSGSALVMVLVTYLVIMLWAVLLFVPAIWAYARYFATVPAFAIEKLGAFEAIRRSKQLAKHNNGRAIALALVPVVVFTIILGLAQQGLLGSGAGMRVTQVFSSLLALALYPFMVVPAIFLYYDLRTRREGLDLDFASLPNAAA